ncbi:MAG: GNAT family N-acetyltransferase [Phyllobacterium sp.]
MTKAGRNLDWRLMEVADLPSVSLVAAAVHPDFPEDDAIFAERLSLYPEGCFVLTDGTAILGYCLSHPWRSLSIPALDTLLGALPGETTNYYLHDIALLPEARSGGAASRVVSGIADNARRNGFATISLVAVNASGGFWERQGFVVQHEAELDAKLRSYSDDALFMVRQLNG